MGRKKEATETVDIVEETKKNKNSALDLAFNQINKKHGSVLKWLSDVPSGYEFISTGSISMDHALGGGFPRGRMIEIFGEESTGKSTVALGASACANRMGLKVLYIDCERAIDRKLVAGYGVDPSMFLLDNVSLSMEEHFDVVYGLLGTGEIGMVVVDSVPSLIPKAELAGDAGDSHVGLQARFLSQEGRRIVNMIGESNTLFIFINQLREKVMAYGDPRVTPGGKAIKFYSTHRVSVDGSGKTKSARILDDKGVLIGHKMSYQVVKNKISAPFRSGSVDLIYGKGFDKTSELVDLSTDLGIIQLGGAWYTIPEVGEKIQGRDSVKAYFDSNPDFMARVEKQIREMLAL